MAVQKGAVDAVRMRLHEVLHMERLEGSADQHAQLAAALLRRACGLAEADAASSRACANQVQEALASALQQKDALLAELEQLEGQRSWAGGGESQGQANLEVLVQQIAELEEEVDEGGGGSTFCQMLHS